MSAVASKLLVQVSSWLETCYKSSQTRTLGGGTSFDSYSPPLYTAASLIDYYYSC
jgi:hypothetical protein